MDEHCTICLENYKKNKEIQTLHCNHQFHKNCILEWLSINPLCPICKSTQIVNFNFNGLSDDINIFINYINNILTNRISITNIQIDYTIIISLQITFLIFILIPLFSNDILIFIQNIFNLSNNILKVLIISINILVKFILLLIFPIIIKIFNRLNIDIIYINRNVSILLGLYIIYNSYLLYQEINKIIMLY